ncbi:hypothetical protein QTP70_018552, partial [Hemibagrus guttatus]
QISKCMDTEDSGVHAYDRQTLLQYSNHATTNLHDVLKKLCYIGLLRRPGLSPRHRLMPVAGREDIANAYRLLIRCSKPVLKQVKTWPAGFISALQDCSGRLQPMATINLEEYTSVTSYIGKCIDDVTVSKTITTHSNQKPWMTAEVHVCVE